MSQSYVNSKRSSKQHIKALRNKNGFISNNQSDIVDLLNRQFKSVFLNEDNATLPEFDARNNGNSRDFDVDIIDLEMIKEKLSKLNAVFWEVCLII